MQTMRPACNIIPFPLAQRFATSPGLSGCDKPASASVHVLPLAHALGACETDAAPAGSNIAKAAAEDSKPGYSKIDLALSLLVVVSGMAAWAMVGLSIDGRQATIAQMFAGLV